MPPTSLILTVDEALALPDGPDFVDPFVPGHHFVIAALDSRHHVVRVWGYATYLTRKAAKADLRAIRKAWADRDAELESL